MSLSNLRGQNQSMTESQEELAQGGDYNVNPPSSRYNAQNNQYQQVAPNTQRQTSQPLPPSTAPNGLKSLIDRIPKDSANLSMRSNESNTPSGIYQSVQRKQQNLQNSAQNSYSQQNYNNNQQQGSFEQLDEYYTVSSSSLKNHFLHHENKIKIHFRAKTLFIIFTVFLQSYCGKILDCKNTTSK